MKNKVLWMITNMNVMSLLISIIMLDSDSWIPFIVMWANIAWLLLFVGVNFDYFERRYHGI